LKELIISDGSWCGDPSFIYWMNTWVVDRSFFSPFLLHRKRSHREGFIPSIGMSTHVYFPVVSPFSFTQKLVKAKIAANLVQEKEREDRTASMAANAAKTTEQFSAAALEANADADDSWGRSVSGADDSGW
jgi:hypothetical protein